MCIRDRDLAVAVEDIGPGGGECVRPDAAAGAVAVALLREHYQPQRDDAVDSGEGDDGEAEPRLGLHVAIDVAAIEKRAQPALPAGLQWFPRRVHRITAAPARCRWCRARPARAWRRSDRCPAHQQAGARAAGRGCRCLLYTSDAADDLTRVDLGGRRII